MFTDENRLNAAAAAIALRDELTKPRGCEAIDWQKLQAIFTTLMSAFGPLILQWMFGYVTPQPAPPPPAAAPDK